jgi:hypothetical protein
MCAAGYSGTPLAKKLGIKEGTNIMVLNPPGEYMEMFDEFPDNVTIAPGNKTKKDLIHYFATEQKKLVKDMFFLKNSIVADGCIWISWPKKASGVSTDITEDVIRNIALQNGLVDIKVCAVDNIWSGLKLVIPLRDRR